MKRDENTIRVGDLVGHRLSDDSWFVTIGENTQPALGRIYPQDERWVAKRWDQITDTEGTSYGVGEPHILGTTETIEDAIVLYETPIFSDQMPQRVEAGTGLPVCPIHDERLEIAMDGREFLGLQCPSCDYLLGRSVPPTV